MDVVEQLLIKTKSLHSHLKKGMPETDRDNYIEKTYQLIEERQSLISKLSGSYTKQEQKTGAQIVSLNKEIDTMLKKQANCLKRELEQFKQKKQLSHQYANPYANITVDGMFFDKKK